ERTPIATLSRDELAPGDTIRVRNLRSGEHDEVRLLENGRARLTIAGDAMDDQEKSIRFGLGELERGESYTFTGTEAVDKGVGDPMVIEIVKAGQAAPTRVID